MIAQRELLPGTYPARVRVAAGVADGEARAVYAAAAPGLADEGARAVLEAPRLDLYWFDRPVDQALQGQELGAALAAEQTTTAYLACVAGGGGGPACVRQVEPSYAGLQPAPERQSLPTDPAPARAYASPSAAERHRRRAGASPRRTGGR